MLRRRDQHGLVLIPQAEVGRLAAHLLSRLGGGVDVPRHLPALVRAAEWSQRGWEELDDFPPLDARSLPCEEEDLPRHERIAAWSRTTASAWEHAEEGQGEWWAAALLSILALQWSAKPSLHRGETRRDNFDFNQLTHLEAERLDKAHEALGLRKDIATRHGLPEAGEAHGELIRAERELVREVRLLESMLELAREVCAHSVVERTLGVISRDWRASEELLRARWLPGGGALQVSPWFSGEGELSVTIAARAVSPRRYRDAADLRQAITQATEIKLDVTLRPHA